MANATDRNVISTIVKGAAGTLYHVEVFCPWRNVFLQVFDKASAPASGDQAVVSIPVGPDGRITLDYPAGRAFANGIALGISDVWDTWQGNHGGNLFDAQYA